MTIVWILVALSEAVKWFAIIACIAVICWLTKRPILRDVAYGLLVGAVIGVVALLPKPFFNLELNPSYLFNTQIYLLICLTGAVFVAVKRQMETRLRTHAYHNR